MSEEIDLVKETDNVRNAITHIINAHDIHKVMVKEEKDRFGILLSGILDDWSL